MKHLFSVLAFILLSIPFTGCSDQESIESKNGLTIDDYTKTEKYITMRDGVSLFTVIYSPKDTSQTYPALVRRTPYGCAPYGKDTMSTNLCHNPDLLASGYHFIIQDMRGRWMSEGEFENVKPPYSFEDSTKTDEVTDSYDTFDWIVDSLDHFNGSIGQYGNSYLGWTSLVAGVSQHPNLKAILAMAPVTNFYFEDFNRYGLCAMNYIPVMNVFGTQTGGPVSEAWWDDHEEIFSANVEEELDEDYYHFFLNRMALSEFNDVFGENNFFWNDIQSHPTYDDFNQKRDWIQYLDRINCATMIVGGWNDEQNLYGILNAYKKVCQTNSNSRFVMGPWSHGHPKRRDSLYYLGNVFYGYDLAKHYQEEIEFNYFEYYLKGNGKAPEFTVKLFDTGKKEWTYFDSFLSIEVDSVLWFLNSDGNITTSMDQNSRTYISDPFHPVPYIEDDHFYRMAPKSYFTDDQRFASKRPDVLTYVTAPLDEDLTVLGEIKAMIDFATDHKDADLFVKIIDVYPMDRLPDSTDIEGVKMNGYQQLVRAGYIRGRYRESFEQGKPFVANQKTTVNVPLLEIYHTFKTNHRIMVQIQSSWFPLFDLNPQNYVENIYKAQKTDFELAFHKVFGTSKIIFPVVR